MICCRMDFVKIFTSMDSYTGSGSFEGWMRKIFVNCALEYLRKSDVLREATDLDNTAELIQPDSSAISDMSAADVDESSEGVAGWLPYRIQYVRDRGIFS